MSPVNQNTALLKKLASKQLEQAVEMSNLRNAVDDLQEGMIRVLYLLENDSKTGSKGIVEQVRSNTMFRQDFKSKVTVLGVVGGALFWVATLILKLIFKQ